MFKYSFLACAFISSLVNAQNTTISSLPLTSNYGQKGYVGFSGTFSATRDSLQSQSLDEFGVDLSAGYFFLPYLGMEVSYANDFGLFSGENFEHTDLQLMTRYSLSDYAELYMGAGATYMLNSQMKSQGSNVDLMGTFGVRYHIDPAWAIDVGYKFYNDPGAWNSSVANLNVGVKYYFGSVDPEPVLTSGSSHQLPSKPEVNSNQVISPVPAPLPVEPTCHTEKLLTDYYVKNGDWLYKIARNFDMDFDDLIRLNQSVIKKVKDKNLIYSGMKLKVYKEQEVCTR